MNRAVFLRAEMFRFMFRLYICNLIPRVTALYLDCHYAGMVINLLAYADNMVVLALSWHSFG